MTYEPAITASDEHEPRHAASQTAHLLDELQLYGYRPFGDEPDPRPLPGAMDAENGISACAETLAGLLADTRLEDDTDDLLWSFTHIFHRKLAFLDRALDDNEQAQRRSADEQDGSEIKSVELERLIAQGISIHVWRFEWKLWYITPQREA